MDYNKFIDTHKVRYCIHFNFQDYVRARSRVKGPLTEQSTGKAIPTPNQIVRKIAKGLKGDSAVKDFANGAIQRMLVADEKEFRMLIKNAPITEGDGKPCTVRAMIEITANDYLSLAKKYGLI